MSASTKSGEIKGKTDETGAFKFETDLPDYFVGEPLEQGKAFAKLDIEVTDRAEHTEKITQMVPVAKDSVIITAVPESGEIKPGLENIVYVLCLHARRDSPSPKATVVSCIEPPGVGASTRRSSELDSRTEPGIAEVRPPQFLEKYDRPALVVMHSERPELQRHALNLPVEAGASPSSSAPTRPCPKSAIPSPSPSSPPSRRARPTLT